MRELTSAERLDVNGGILPLVLAAAAAVVLGGCATQGAKDTCPEGETMTQHDGGNGYGPTCAPSNG